MTINGRTPHKTPSSSMTSYAPVKNKKLRKLIITSEVEEEKEEEETDAPLVRKINVAFVGAHKVVERAIQREVHLLYLL